MKKPAIKIIAWSLSVLACAVVAKADSLINSFDFPADYVADGVMGDTNWDGVYLNFGDIPNGNAGGSGGGSTLVANSTDFPGYLSLQTTRGDWSGNGDDGFFLWKVVSGDFDVSVETVPPFPNLAYNFAGLMVRAYNTNNSGGPFSTTLTNAAENFVALFRFNEFGLDGEIRISTNGGNQELTFPGDDAETNSSRFFRITRVGNVFTFYVKTNAADAWSQITSGLPSGTLTRNDWDGVSLQVGIAQAMFSANSPVMYFDNFNLSGPNVTFPTMPTPASAFVQSGSNPGGSLTLSWTLGTPGDNSLVVMSQHPIRVNPVNGLTYSANSAYGSADALLGGGQYVVYNGTGTSVTVTNLGANNLTYYAAVFEYAGSGASAVYNTAGAVTNFFAGPGVINSISISSTSTNIPVGGATSFRMLASFSTGESNVDRTLDGNWSSDNPSVLTVGPDGTANGISAGTAKVTVSFGSFSESVDVTVHSLVGFADDFTAMHDYLNDGVVGSMWDGVFLKYGDVPGGAAGGDGPGSTAALDSQISSTNGLVMNSVASTWQGSADDGPFLFKIVPGANNLVSGDFQVSLHITNMNVLNGVVAGLMARVYNPANAGPGPSGSENHVNYWKVQNGSTSVRRIQNGSTTTLVGAGPSGTTRWLLIQRVNSTNFYFFEKDNAIDSWTFVTNTVLTAAANDAPMEVGIAEQSTTGVNGIATFDNFWLDAEGISGGGAPPPPAQYYSQSLNSADLSMTLTWVAADGSGNPVPSIAVMRAGDPISAQPIQGASVTANSVFGQGSDLGAGNYVVYESANPPSSTNNTVTVTGLTPGETYYAAVFTFSGTGATKVFNVTSAPGSSLVDGTPREFLTPSSVEVPRGGIGTITAQVGYGYTNTVVVIDRTSSISIETGDTNIIKVLDRVLTGITNGSTTLTVTYDEGAFHFTNYVTATVRTPTFTDNFDTSRDYLTAGFSGSGWDGLYDPPLGTLVPDSPYIANPSAGATVADANITSNGVLTVTSSGDGWENAAAGGWFLFKYVPGDFQTAVHIVDYQIAGYNMPGLLARAYSTGTNGTTIGAPFVIGPLRTNVNGIILTNYGESFVSLCRFDEFNIGTYARRNLDSAVTQSTQTDPNDGNNWLLIVRSKGTEFDFYKRASETDPWQQVPNKTHYSIAAFAGQPMQVGIMAEPWSGPGTMRTAMLDDFMLDSSKGLELKATVSGKNLILTWPADPNASLESTTSIDPTSWSPVSGTKTLGPNGYTLSVPIGTGNMYFRLVN